MWHLSVFCLIFTAGNYLLIANQKYWNHRTPTFISQHDSETVKQWCHSWYFWSYFTRHHVLKRLLEAWSRLSFVMRQWRSGWFWWAETEGDVLSFVSVYGAEVGQFLKKLREVSGWRSLRPEWQHCTERELELYKGLYLGQDKLRVSLDSPFQI